MTAHSGDQRHTHTGSRRHTSIAATTSSKTRCNFSKKAIKVAAAASVALAVVLFLTLTFDRDDPKNRAGAGRDHHELAGNGKHSALDIPMTPLIRGFLRGDNEPSSKGSSDELEDRDTIQAMLSSLEEKREESFDIVTRDADAALKAADDAVKAGAVAVAAAEEASECPP